MRGGVDGATIEVVWGSGQWPVGYVGRRRGAREMCHSFGPLEGGRANTTVFGVLSFAIFGTPDQQRERRNNTAIDFWGVK